VPSCSLVRSSRDEDDEQSALIVYFQTGERTIAKDVRLELLCQVKRSNGF
jgi:hypothetical protein